MSRLFRLISIKILNKTIGYEKDKSLGSCMPNVHRVWIS